MESQGKEKSPYPRLQAVLPQLSSIGPNQENRAVYDTRAEAEEHIEQARQEEGKFLRLKPCCPSSLPSAPTKKIARSMTPVQRPGNTSTKLDRKKERSFT